MVETVVDCSVEFAGQQLLNWSHCGHTTVRMIKRVSNITKDVSREMKWIKLTKSGVRVERESFHLQSVGFRRPLFPCRPAVKTKNLRIMMNLSIITACIPLLKRFLTDLQTGFLDTTIHPSQELSTGKRSGAWFWNTTNESSSKSGRSGGTFNLSRGRTRKKGQEAEDDGIQLTQDGIVQTTDIRVDFNDPEASSGRSWYDAIDQSPSFSRRVLTTS